MCTGTKHPFPLPTFLSEFISAWDQSNAEVFDYFVGCDLEQSAVAVSPTTGVTHFTSRPGLVVNKIGILLFCTLPYVSNAAGTMHHTPGSNIINLDQFGWLIVCGTLVAASAAFFYFYTTGVESWTQPSHGPGCHLHLQPSSTKLTLHNLGFSPYLESATTKNT